MGVLEERERMIEGEAEAEGAWASGREPTVRTGPTLTGASPVAPDPPCLPVLITSLHTSTSLYNALLPVPRSLTRNTHRNPPSSSPLPTLTASVGQSGSRAGPPSSASYL